MRGVRSGGRLARAVLPQHSHGRTCPPRGSAHVWDPGASSAGAERAAVHSSELLSGVLPACSGGLGRVLLQCHLCADTRLESSWLPAMFVGRAGPCSMDPCQCSALLVGSRGRGAPPGTHMPRYGAREVIEIEYLSS